MVVIGESGPSAAIGSMGISMPSNKAQIVRGTTITVCLIRVLWKIGLLKEADLPLGPHSAMSERAPPSISIYA